MVLNAVRLFWYQQMVRNMELKGKKNIKQTLKINSPSLIERYAIFMYAN